MTSDTNLSIEEKTLVKILTKKKEMGFGEKKWDEWFDYIFNHMNSQKLTQDGIEKKWEKVYYEKFYDIWVQNFALNLNDIWRDSSAKELDPTKDPKYEMRKNTAIIIGRGPSVKEHRHLELLANSNYSGTIICTDGSLINALKMGITPKKFPSYFVVTIDAREEIKESYDDAIVDKYGSLIQGIFSTFTNPLTIKRARESGIKIHWLHTLFDYNEGKTSFNKISALMVRAKNHPHGLPAIQTGGNVGTSSWFVSWQLLKCTTVTLIGINHGWNENDPWDVILSHGYTHSPIQMDKDNPMFQKLFPKIYNPEFKCYCILDPIFQYYSTALKEFISRSPSWVTTINATEGGCIFGERIRCLTLNEFLKENI